MLDHITPVIITYNEIANIKRTLAALSWAKKIVVVDSFSDDGTVEFCQQQSNVEVTQRAFDNFAGQCNYALEHLVSSEWVLSLDADYIVTEALQKEISHLADSLQNPVQNKAPNKAQNSIAAYTVSFTYAIHGQNIRGSLYPPRTVLYRRDAAQYAQDGHAHRVHIQGPVATLNNKIIHDDRKPYSRWLQSQYNYANQEQQKLAQTPFRELSWTDKVRRIPGLAPVLVIPYLLFIKGLLFSGKPGMLYVKQRIQAEYLLQKALFLPSERFSSTKE